MLFYKVLLYLIQFIHMGVVRHTWAFQKQFSMLNLQYVITELSYDANSFLYTVAAKLQQKQRINTAVPSSLLTAWFLTQSFSLGSGQ